MDLHLKNKVVLVTASAHGLGKGIAKGFLEEGAKVIINGVSNNRVYETRKELENQFDKEYIYAFQGDLTKDKDIKQFVDETISNYGRIDILVANLGSGKGSSDWNIPNDDWHTMMNLNFEGARKLTNEVVPYMISNSSGSIVYISSIAGIEVIGAPIHYSVAKAALVAFAKNLSKKLASFNIRVNVVCPGNIYFKDGAWDYKLRENKQKVLEMLENTVPLKRFATPIEIANTVLFLASEKASFITGANLVADGGQTVKI